MKNSGKTINASMRYKTKVDGGGGLSTDMLLKSDMWQWYSLAKNVL